MESALTQHSGLAEAGLTGDAHLEGAAAGTSLSLPYCRYLASALLEAVRAASDKSLDRPHLNKFTVFAETWHAASLARLSDADIANLWRLADYLMLDAACFRCLKDIVVQSEVRTGVQNQLLSLGASDKDKIAMRVKGVVAEFRLYSQHAEAVSRGLSTPTSISDIGMAVEWAHWDLLLQARAAGIEWSYGLTAYAAACGHLHLLQRLRYAGCPWDEDVVNNACWHEYESIAIWALDNGAPTYGKWLKVATRSGCQQVLRWAWEHGRLPANMIPVLKQKAQNYPAIANWLDSL
jgi:hypothetical protein